jgi:GDP-L-fucose synthase
MNNKILITGSNGLLGSALKKVLGENHIYHTRKDADLTDYNQTYQYLKNAVDNYGVNTIIHTAAKVGGIMANMKNNNLFFYDNYQINTNILKAAYNLNIDNFVNTLSTCIFPDKNIQYPLTPNQIDNGEPHETNYGYSYAKRLSGYETKIFRNITNKNWYSIIPTNIYGPNDNFNLENSHLIPALIHKCFLAKNNNEKFIIWGDGSPLRQFIHSEDLAKLIIWSIDNWNRDEHCMIINENEISVKDVVNIIKDKFQVDDNQILFDVTKPNGQLKKTAKSNINCDFQFKPINEGIGETIDWFLENYQNIRK